MPIVLHAPASGIAQSGPSVDPGQVEQRFSDPNALETLPDAPPVFIRQLPEFEAPPEAADTFFVLNGITVVSALKDEAGQPLQLVYPAEELEAMASNLIGKEVAVLAVFDLADAIRAKYQQDGYPFSFAYIPQQEAENGQVTIAVVEGFIGTVELDEALREDRQEMLDTARERLLASRPLHVDDLDAYLLLLDGLPGLRVSSKFLRSEDTLGATTMLLEAAEIEPFNASLSVDNRGTKTIGQRQGTAALTLNNLAGWYEQTSILAAATPQRNELWYLSVSQQHTLNSYGTTLRGTATRSRSEPGDSLKDLDVESRSVTLALSARHPLILRRERTLYARMGFTVRNSKSDQQGAPTSRDRIRTLDAGLSYADDSNQLGLTLTQGLDVFGAIDRDGTLKSRSDGRPVFTKLELDAVRTQTLIDDFQLVGRATAQWSAHSLLSSQELGLGGSTFGRAYDPSEVTGDHGFAGSLELRYTPNLFGAATTDNATETPDDEQPMPWLRGIQLYGFYDIGSVFDRNPQNQEHGQASLASAGAGLRFWVTDYVSGSMELAKPLTRVIEDEGDKDPRFFFQVSTQF